MEDKHRKAIVQWIQELVKIPNFEEVVNYLVNYGIYSRDMVEELLAKNTPSKGSKAQTLFLDVQTRGPTAFSFLQEALLMTGNADVAFKMFEDFKERENFLKRGAIYKIPILFEDEVDSSSNSSFAATPPKKRTKANEKEELPIIASTIATKPKLAHNCEKELKETPEEQPLPEITLCVFGITHEESKITVVPAKNLYNGYPDIKECYIMKSQPRGMALIVNNIDFIGDPCAKRNGAEYDSINLKMLLEQMGYKVTLAENVTKDKLLNYETGILSDFIKKLDISDVDSCIVSLNSHGFNRDLIRMSDPPGRSDESGSIDLVVDIIRRFSNRNFPGFHGKPKVFLVNACRGSNENRAIRKSFKLEHAKIRSDGEGTTEPIIEGLGSEYSDIFVLRSTVPEYVSLRDLDKGTWFVECLCKATAQYAHQLHFTDLKCKVSSFMEKMYDESSRGMQSCHYEEYGITKRLYFNPGL